MQRLRAFKADQAFYSFIHGYATFIIIRDLELLISPLAIDVALREVTHGEAYVGSYVGYVDA